MGDTKEKILHAAIDEFAESGYKRGTVRGICRRAGVNVAAINYHFSGKRNLYRALLEYLFPNFNRQLIPDSAHIDSQEALRSRLRDWISHTLGQVVRGHNAERRRGMQIVMYELIFPSEVRDDLFRKFSEPSLRALEEILRKGLPPDTPDDEVHIRAFSIAGSCLSYLYQHYILEKLSGDVNFLKNKQPLIVERLLAEAMLGLQYRA